MACDALALGGETGVVALASGLAMAVPAQLAVIALVLAISVPAGVEAKEKTSSATPGTGKAKSVSAKKSGKAKCISKSNWPKFNEREGKAPRSKITITYCSRWRDYTCCGNEQADRARFVTSSMADLMDIKGEPLDDASQCLQHWQALQCAICVPEVGVLNVTEISGRRRKDLPVRLDLDLEDEDEEDKSLTEEQEHQEYLESLGEDVYDPIANMVSTAGYKRNNAIMESLRVLVKDDYGEERSLTSQEEHELANRIPICKSFALKINRACMYALFAADTKYPLRGCMQGDDICYTGKEFINEAESTLVALAGFRIVDDEESDEYCYDGTETSKMLRRKQKQSEDVAKTLDSHMESEDQAKQILSGLGGREKALAALLTLGLGYAAYSFALGPSAKSRRRRQQVAKAARRSAGGTPRSGSRLLR